MGLKIFYTPRSKETLISVYNLIHEKFGLRSAEMFVIKAEKTIERISKQPLMFKASDIGEDVRIALITKQCSLFYSVSDTSIYLLFFWDNRQDPL